MCSAAIPPIGSDVCMNQHVGYLPQRLWLSRPEGLLNISRTQMPHQRVLSGHSASCSPHCPALVPRSSRHRHINCILPAAPRHQESPSISSFFVYQHQPQSLASSAVLAARGFDIPVTTSTPPQLSKAAIALALQPKPSPSGSQTSLQPAPGKKQAAAALPALNRAARRALEKAATKAAKKKAAAASRALRAPASTKGLSSAATPSAATPTAPVTHMAGASDLQQLHRTAALGSASQQAKPGIVIQTLLVDSKQSGEATCHSDAESADVTGAEEIEEGEEDLFPEVQLNLPPPSHSRVRTAEYVKSSVRHEDCPPARFPEFAVIGRSNVGKSSLINLLTSSKNLALVSKEPGKTKCINHFIINNSWYLVDLPGYGFAKTAKDTRTTFDTFTWDYFASRSSLAMVFLLIDGSITPQQVDLEYADRLQQAGVCFSIIFTKVDKRKKGGPGAHENVVAFKRALLARGFVAVPPNLVTSAADGTGRTQVLGFMSSLRVQCEASGRLAAVGRFGRPPLARRTRAAGGRSVDVPDVDSSTDELSRKEVGTDRPGLQTDVAVHNRQLVQHNGPLVELCRHRSLSLHLTT